MGRSYAGDTITEGDRTDATGDAGTYTDGGTYTDTLTDGTGTFTDNDHVDERARMGKSVREQRKRVRRYRGFSTSISSLFLDESLVCTSVSCFGLLLSQRTEHLLNERNRSRGISRRGRKSGERRPSHMLAVALVMTATLMALTYVIWGFGDGKGMMASGWSSGGWDATGDGNEELYYDQVDNGQDENEGDEEPEEEGGRRTEEDDPANPLGVQSRNRTPHKKPFHQQDESARNHQTTQDIISLNTGGRLPPMLGITKIRDYRDHFFNPVLEMIKYEWSDRREEVTTFNQGSSLVKGRSSDEVGGDVHHGSSHHAKGQHNAGELLEGVGVTEVLKKDADDNEPHLKKEPNDPKKRHLNEGYYDDYYDDYYYDDDFAESGSWIRLFLWLNFLVLLGIVGRRRRMRTRYALLRARAEEDELYYAAHARVAPDTDDESAISSERRRFGDAGFGTREDQYEGACSHTLCGCYPVDPPELQSDMFDDWDQYYVTNPDGTPQIERDSETREEKSNKKKQEKREDCLSRAFACLLSACCGCVCKLWVQCFSICALAQEAREVRLLTSPRIQRVDLVTHQPFFGYYRAIVALRRRWKERGGSRSWSWGARCTAHFKALSHLSRYIVMAFTVVTIAVVLALRYNPRANFEWADSLVILLTFAQSFLVIFFVHWIYHKSDLSLDAVIKFFAVGFVIAMPTAFIFEGISINMMLFVVNIAKGLLYWQFDEAYDDFVQDHYLAFWIVGELINAYLVASLVEEVCKYYAFRAMEHPDLIFLTGLENDDPDKKSVYGGVRNYTYASHNVVEAKNSRSFDENDFDISIKRSFSQDNDHNQFEEQNEVRTLRQRAAATATAMISCAVGLACAENFIYVFFFGSANASGSSGSSVAPELGMLVLRSVFPVHPLCAAMQSIGVVKKFLEDPPAGKYPGRIGVGKIVLPAVILHGTFDAAIMCISVYIESRWQNWNGENVDADGNAPEVDDGFTPYHALLVNLVAWGSIVATMFFGLIWYWIQNGHQKARLKRMEERENRENSHSQGQGRIESEHPTGSYASPESELPPE